jgi:N-hydroxyarylamine O-acetyltransferase
MNLDAYFDRIGYGGGTQANLDTLTGIQHAHLDAVPYENLDIQLGGKKTISESAFFDAIVTRKRGGWCYEMNGLLTTALRQLGFEVKRVGGAVARNLIMDDALGNHLVGLVTLEGATFVADVGLGDGPWSPFELAEGDWREHDLHFRLEILEDGWWRFHNHEHGLAASFDFTEEQRSLDWYRPKCDDLQTNLLSPFVNYAMAFQKTEQGARSLRDTTLIEVHGTAKQESELTDEAQYREVLLDILGSDLGDEAGLLWSKVSERASRRPAAD